MAHRRPNLYTASHAQGLPEYLKVTILIVSLLGKTLCSLHQCNYDNSKFFHNSNRFAFHTLGIDILQIWGLFSAFSD